MQIADEFRAECDRIAHFLSDLDPADFSRRTAFKEWTVDMILRHLHVWNMAAYLSLTDEAELKALLKDAMAPKGDGGINRFESAYCGGLAGPALLDAWRAFYPQLAEAFANTDPKARLAWVGPSMSARSSMTARLMESWAHLQAIYDEMGVHRTNTDVIGNIVVLGYNTYDWAFKNRQIEPPVPRPQLRLTAPSGKVWIHGEESGEELISGAAEEFCQVVTQTRNIADTRLKVEGQNARRWMAIAQCFAGPPSAPPEPGTRRLKVNQGRS